MKFAELPEVLADYTKEEFGISGLSYPTPPPLP